MSTITMRKPLTTILEVVWYALNDNCQTSFSVMLDTKRKSANIYLKQKNKKLKTQSKKKY
jgi:hypothetical protein